MVLASTTPPYGAPRRGTALNGLRQPSDAHHLVVLRDADAVPANPATGAVAAGIAPQVQARCRAERRVVAGLAVQAAEIATLIPRFADAGPALAAALEMGRTLGAAATGADGDALGPALPRALGADALAAAVAHLALGAVGGIAAEVGEDAGVGAPLLPTQADARPADALLVVGASRAGAAIARRDASVPAPLLVRRAEADATTADLGGGAVSGGAALVVRDAPLPADLRPRSAGAGAAPAQLAVAAFGA